MKNILILLVAFLLITSFLQAQPFKVIHVKGDIVAESTKESLARGSGFGEKEQFLYKSNSARAVVVNTEVGKRYILKGTMGTAYTKANLIPPMSNMSSRGGALNNRLDLKNHFQGEYVILDKLDIEINPDVFPMNENNFFFIKYLYKAEPINKKLAYKDNILIIEKDALLKVDDKPILNKDITDMSLYYYSKNNDSISTILISSTFYPVFPNNDDLKEETKILIDALKLDNKEEIIKQITNYIGEVYGKPNKENITEWYNNNYK